MKRWIVAMTGASGAPYGVRLLQALQAQTEVETELVLSRPAELTIRQETDLSPEAVRAMATRHYDEADIGASIASGSYPRNGMVIAPCSVKTMSCVAHALNLNLVHRAADVTLKERKPLIILIREAPLHAVHLENLLALARLGAIIVPAAPSFYTRPQSIDDLVSQLTGRLLDLMELPNTLVSRWTGGAA
ncbi:MAG: UbiX family flavin prenyltransferase [Candidatus Xenobia bacterium]